MVAQRNTTLRMRSRVTRGKENILSSYRLRRKEETYLRKHELGISIFRSKLQARVDQFQNVEETLDRHARQMQLWFMQFMDLVENTKKFVSEEREETMQLLQSLDDCVFDQTEVALKTQTVTPMIYGIPLKRASIALTRLDPFGGQQNRNMPRAFADSSAACDVGFAHATASPNRHRNMEPLEVDLVSSSSEDEGSCSDHVFGSGYLGRLRCETSNRVSSQSAQAYNLKIASVPLTRLDPRPYLPGKGSTQSPNLNPERIEIEPDAAELIHSSAVPVTHSEAERPRRAVCIENGRNCTSCLTLLPDPTVVLKRLRPMECPGELNHHDQSAKLSVTITGTRKKRKAECTACVMPDRSKAHCRATPGKKIVKENTESSKVVKKAKPRNNKKNESQLADSPPNKVDEDPLEGPSWLYKDGVKKERLRKFKKIRQGYLTPLYYLAPTIYSSTDDSGDEMTENERKSSKRRKKKQKRRNSCL